MSRRGYIIQYAEPNSNPSFFLRPSKDETPWRVYLNLDEAKKALVACAEKALTSTPIQYGEAFPFDMYTFDSHLNKKGYAIYSIIERQGDDEDDDVIRLGVCLVSIDIV